MRVQKSLSLFLCLFYKYKYILSIMIPKGFLHVAIQSIDFDCVSYKICIDSGIHHQVSPKQLPFSNYYPCQECFQVTLEGSPNSGYFKLPLAKVYQFPFVQHSITVNCITKTNGHITNTANGVIKMIITYLKDATARLELHIIKLNHQVKEEEKQQSKLYVECKLGDVQSQTTVRAKDNLHFNEIIPFTLQDAPEQLILSIVEQDVGCLGSVQLCLQQQNMLQSINQRVCMVNEEWSIEIKAVFILNQ